jgi:hypothetical protein
LGEKIGLSGRENFCFLFILKKKKEEEWVVEQNRQQKWVAT